MNDKLEKRQKTIDVVSVVSLVIVLAIAIWAVAFNGNFTEISNGIFSFLTTDFAWLYLLVVVAFVFFCVFLAVSKWGKIRLGADDSRPEFSTPSWFAMLFGAGMGVGLVFWGVAEPLSHFVSPAPGIEAGTAEAAEFAIKSSFMHWGIEPWACYAVIGLGLAYFQFRKKKPGLISSMLEPLIGEKRAQGWLGKLVDILAVFATVAGVVTSLGLGVLQINGGINHLFGVPKTLMVQIIIIAVVAVIYIWTAVSGVDKGIKALGDINMWLAIIIMVVCFIVGPTVMTLNNFTNGLGQYINNFMQDSLTIHAFGDNSWFANWRVFYWAWFIAWAPFVGIFIARISKGRTIREFVAGVMVAPAMASFVWFAIFGSMGLNLGMNGTLGMDKLQEVVATPEVGLFVVLEQYPIGFILCIVALVLLCTFFITSANSGVFVLSMLTSKGALNPPNRNKIIWGVIQAVVAVGLLMAGGLKPLQTMSIAAAFPFIFIMLAAMVALVKALKKEKRVKKEPEGEKEESG